MANVQEQVQQHAQQIADTAAATSIGAAGYAWLGTANEIVQLIAGIVAIVAGCAAAWWHIKKIRSHDAEKDSSSER